MIKQYIIYVKPGSRKGPLIQQQPDCSLLVFVRQRAADGQANDAVIQLLSGHFKVAKSKIRIQRGQASRVKQVVVDEGD